MNAINERNLGTPESIYKNLSNATKEPLDLCLHHDLITTEEHTAGIMYRIIFTKIFGLPHAPAYDLNQIKGRKIADPSQDEEYYKIDFLYKLINANLIKKRARQVISDICVYNVMPEFLSMRRTAWHLSKELALFKDGLGIINETLNVSIA